MSKYSRPFGWINIYDGKHLDNKKEIYVLVDECLVCHALINSPDIKEHLKVMHGIEEVSKQKE